LMKDRYIWCTIGEIGYDWSLNHSNSRRKSLHNRILFVNYVFIFIGAILQRCGSCGGKVMLAVGIHHLDY